MGCFAAYQVNHLVVELDAKDPTASRICDCILVARAQVVVAFENRELRQDLKR